MPLTTRTNGSGPSNIVAASWWNDYLNLLTGVMTDQVVTINNTVNVITLNAQAINLSGGSSQISCTKVAFPLAGSSLSQLMSITGTGNGTFLHGLSVIPTHIIPVCISSAGTGVPYVTNKTTTNFVMNGTNGCQWKALIILQ